MSEILRHGRILERLQSAAGADRLPHALLFSGPDGIGKRTVAEALARELVATDEEDRERFSHGVHERYVVYSDLEKALPVRRRDLVSAEFDEDALLDAYGHLQSQDWIRGVYPGRGADVVDLLERNPERFLGRKGIPFADVLERELAALDRTKKMPRGTTDVARRLFSAGTSRVPYRRTLGIDLVNGRGDGSYFRSVESLLRTSSTRWRVAILDDADRMTDEAANAFLKTLEEPPPNTLLVLVTSKPLSLLATTVSRCAPVVFESPTATEIAAFLGTQGVPDPALLAALADGSVRRALELRTLDLPSRRAALEEVLRAVAAGELAASLEWVGRQVAAGMDPSAGRDGERANARLILEHLALGFRDLVLAGVVPAVAPVSGLAPEVVRPLSATRSVNVWNRLFDRTERALADVDASVEPRLALEALFVEAVPEREGARA